MRSHWLDAIDVINLFFSFFFPFIVLAEPGGMWDLISSLTRDETRVPCIGSVKC